jgi:hypothetical protein
MKTKDFIKLLQKEDPSGESHIRINGNPVWFIESKSGYWDGPYNFGFNQLKVIKLMFIRWI